MSPALAGGFFTTEPPERPSPAFWQSPLPQPPTGSPVKFVPLPQPLAQRGPGGNLRAVVSSEAGSSCQKEVAPS